MYCGGAPPHKGSAIAAAPALDLVLEHPLARLEPLRQSHFDDLAEHAFDPNLWTLTRKRLDTTDDLRRFFTEANLALVHSGELIFAIVDPQTGRAIGSTRYKSVDAEVGELEIGWTWIAAPWHGRNVNAAAKYLMLQHAFEALGFAHVFFRTNLANARSQAALRRMGAEDIGRRDDDQWFVIERAVWPKVKLALESRLGATRT